MVVISADRKMCVVVKRKIEFPSRGECCSPSNPGTPQVTPPKILSAGTPMKPHHKIKDFAPGSPLYISGSPGKNL